MASTPKNQTKAQLKKLVPLNTLPDSAFSELVKECQVEKLERGDYLFRQGDTVPFNFYLLNGMVALLSRGKEVERIKPGSDKSRFPIAHQIPRKYSARALTSSEIVLIDNLQLNQFLKDADTEYKVDELSSMASDDWMSQMLQSRIFQQIPAANIQKVFMKMEQVEVEKGDVIIEQGGEGDFFYMMHRGRARVTRKITANADPIEMDRIGAGDTFGEEALLSDSPRNSSVTMMTAGIILRLSKEDFIELVNQPLARSIDFKEANERIEQGALWVDVREPGVFKKSHVQGSINISPALVRHEVSHLAPDREYILYCETGQQSTTAAFVMIEMGFEVSVLSNGLNAIPPDLLINDYTPHEMSSTISMLRTEETHDDIDQAEAVNDELKLVKKQLEKARQHIKALAFKVKQQEAAGNNKAEIEKLQTALDDSQSQIDSLKKQQQTDQEKLRLSQEKAEDLSLALSSRKQADSNLSEQLQAMQKEKDESKMALLNMKAEVENYKQEAASIKGQLIALEQASLELEEKKQENEKLKKQNQDLEKQLIDQSQQQNQAKNDSDKILLLEKQLAQNEEAKAKLANALEKAQLGQKQEEKLDHKIQDLRQQRDDAQIAFKQAQAKIAELQTELDFAQSQLKEASDIDSVSQIIGESDEVKKLEHQVSQLKAEIDIVKTNARMEVEEVKQQLQSYKEELATSEGLDDIALQQEVDQLRNLVAQKDKQLEQADNEREKLEDSIEDRNALVDKQGIDLDEAIIRNKKLEIQIKKLEDYIEENRAKGMINEKNREADYFYDKPASSQSLIKGLVAGLALMIVGLEGLSLVSGKGELFSFILSSDPQSKPEVVEIPEQKQTLPRISSTTTQQTTDNKQPQNAQQQVKEDSQAEQKVIAEKVKQTKAHPLEGQDLGPQMMLIKGAEFTMGRDGHNINTNEQPSHKVKLKPFAISRGEITFAEYDHFAQATGREFPSDNGWGRGNRPVINVSWEDAQAYVKWLSKRSGQPYRLPTEAEWEFAAQANSETNYWWGYTLGKNNANCFNCNSQWDRKSTAPSGSFKANTFGLVDTAGNVMEWVQDCYHRNYRGAPDDGSAWQETGCKNRVVRGGSYDKPGERMLSTARSFHSTNTRLNNIGFRIALDIELIEQK